MQGFLLHQAVIRRLPPPARSSVRSVADLALAAAHFRNAPICSAMVVLSGTVRATAISKPWPRISVLGNLDDFQEPVRGNGC